MKRILIERMRLLALVAVVFALTSANAQKVTVDGLNYYLYPDTHEAAVDNGNIWSGELVLPSTISYDGETYTVSGMGHMAFYGCKELTKVTIPKTIDQVIHHAFVGMGAVSDEYMNPFVGCTALESIEVDVENPGMKSVGGVLFSKDGTRLYCYPAGLKAEMYVVPQDVTWVGGDAFTYNEYVVSVELPAAVTYIGGGAFTYCKGLEKVSLPDGLAQLRGHSFRDCSSLKSIEIPAKMTKLGEQAFSGCTSLSVIDLPESVQTIGSLAFRNCTLDALVIRGQLDSQSISQYLFSGLNESSKVYTLASQADSFKNLFAGTVLTLDEYKGQAVDNDTPATRPTGVTGFVLNQDYEPIANAKVTLLSRTYDFRQGIDEGMITTKTDEYGHYFFKVDTLRESSWVLVSAEGYPDYTGYYTLNLQEGSQAETIIMVNKARYHQGQYATIVLPTQPEAEWGRFFRLDRVEDDKVIFERESQPQAETPYIIIPDKDFEIAYDANQPSQIVKTSVEGAYFRGYYQPDFFSKKESEYHVTLDGMPDCDYRGSRYSIGEHVVVTNASRIGANRAVLVLDSYQYPWYKLKDSFTWRDDWFLKDGLVLHDATTGESLTWKSAPLTTSHPQSAAYAGFVLNEDNCPVVNATVQLKSDNATLSAATDDYGHFLLPLKDTKGDYELTVIADDLQEQQFQDVWEPYSFTMGSRSDVLTYPEAATFKKGQQATIILPTKPDATWGRFYKLARVDDGKVVFSREMTPQANVPYVIFPEQDFKISYSGLEFPATAGETAVVGARLVGAYAKTPVRRADHEFKLLIDKTNDCQYIYEDLHSAYDAGSSIGALRCMLVLDSDEYDWASYSLVKHMPEAYPYFIERSFVFSDEAVAVTSPTTNRTQNISTLHDLQGRRITSLPRPGMYIREGKVVVVKYRPQ